MKKHTAFSLVELLVTVAILSLLAGFAVPAYQKYTIASRMSAAARSVMMLMNQSISYAAQHGTFADAANLGYNLTFPTNPRKYADDSIATSLISYYLPKTSSGGLQMQDQSTPTACGKMGFVFVYLDATKLGFPTSMATNPPGGSSGVWLECDFWHYAGGINKFCYYSYGTNAAYGTNEILPGWVNYNDLSAPQETNMTGFNTATCQ